MPVLGETNLKKVILKVSSSKDDEAWVKIDTELSVDLVIASMGATKEELKKKSSKELAIEGVEIMVRLVKKWNFTDSAKNPHPITADNLRKLPFADLQTISDAADIEGATKRALLHIEKKRDLSNISSKEAKLEEK